MNRHGPNNNFLYLQKHKHVNFLAKGIAEAKGSGILTSSPSVAVFLAGISDVESCLLLTYLDPNLLTKLDPPFRLQFRSFSADL